MSLESHLSLRLRLALIFVAGCFSTLIVATGFLYLTFRHEINASNQRLLAGKLQDVTTVLANHPDDQKALEEEVLEETSVQAQIFVRVLKDGELRVESRGMSKTLPSNRFVGISRIKIEDSHFLVEIRKEGHYLIQGALDVTEEDRMVIAYRQRLLYTLVLGVAGCTLFGVWAAHHGLKPLRTIAESAQRITVNQLQQRLDPEQFPQELRELVQSLDAMLERLDRAFERLSGFSADLAHELRTPLTNLMGETEVVLAMDRSIEDYQQVLESNMEEYRRLSRLISRMLFLARAEDPSTTIMPVTLHTERLLGEVLAFFEGAAEDQGVKLVGTASGTIRGDAEMLRQALANLISNALEATSNGGEIFVKVIEQEHQAILEVKDSGRGILPDELPKVSDRFYRTTEARLHKSPGTGLGLAIVQSIAQLHGGELCILSEQGKGTTVELKFRF